MLKFSRFYLVLAVFLCLIAGRFAVSQTKEPAAASARSSIADVEKAKSLLQSGKREGAVKHLEESIGYWTEQTKSKPQDAQQRVDLARVLFEFQQDDKALAAIEEAKKLDPKLAAAFSFRGLMYYYAGDNAKARAEYDEAVKLSPRDANVLVDYCQFLVSIKQFDDAKRHLEVMREVAPERLESYEQLSLIFATEGKPEKELEILQLCVKKNPASLKAHQMLGQVLDNSNKAAEAYSEYSAAAKIAPEDMFTAIKLVQLCAMLGKKEEHDQRLKNVYELYSKNGYNQKWFCRDRFQVGESSVAALEFFKLEGPNAVRYGFYVTEKGKTQPSYRVSLGSYDATTEIARSTGAIGKEDRMFHLDYYRGREHRTYGMFAKEPTYEESRKMALEIFEGKREALSGSTMPEKPIEKNP